MTPLTRSIPGPGLVPDEGTGPGQVPGSSGTDQSPAACRPARTVRSWPLLLLAAPAAAEVWSGWIGIGDKTGFGLVRPLPGIWPGLHLDTAFTLPVGVEGYAAYALRAWLASDKTVSPRTRRFAKWSAAASFGLGMTGQIAYHLLAQAGAAHAPWPVTTIVSCLPVLVLAMGTMLAHMLRADAEATDRSGTTPASTTGNPRHWSPDASRANRTSPRNGQGPAARTRAACGPVNRAGQPGRASQHNAARQVIAPGTLARSHARTGTGDARRIASRLAAAGQPVSRRTLRSNGAKGSNASLGALARRVNAGLSTAAIPGAEQSVLPPCDVSGTVPPVYQN